MRTARPIAVLAACVATLLAASAASANAPAARAGESAWGQAPAALTTLGPELPAYGLSASGLGEAGSCTVMLPLGPSGAPVAVVLFPTVLEEDLVALTGVVQAARLDEVLPDPGCRFLEGSLELFD